MRYSFIELDRIESVSPESLLPLLRELAKKNKCLLSWDDYFKEIRRHSNCYGEENIKLPKVGNLQVLDVLGRYKISLDELDDYSNNLLLYLVQQSNSYVSGCFDIIGTTLIDRVFLETKNREQVNSLGENVLFYSLRTSTSGLGAERFFSIWNNLNFEKIDINQRNNNGETLLHLSARVGNMKVFKFLLEQGADKNVLDNNGNSVLNEFLSISSSWVNSGEVFIDVATTMNFNVVLDFVKKSWPVANVHGVVAKESSWMKIMLSSLLEQKTRFTELDVNSLLQVVSVLPDVKRVAPEVSLLKDNIERMCFNDKLLNDSLEVVSETRKSIAAAKHKL